MRVNTKEKFYFIYSVNGRKNATGSLSNISVN